MNIAIDASPAFKHLRTGIEEYSYQLIKCMRSHLKGHDVTLYVRRGTSENIDFPLPRTWKVVEIHSPRLWTYLRLSCAMLFGRHDRLFVPGHIVPPIHPKYTVMVVHGLEFEMTPESFGLWERYVMRFGIKRSCAWAKRIICVSNNSKRDLIDLYGVERKKIRVIYEGVNLPLEVSDRDMLSVLKNFQLTKGGYLLFVGRIEHRKNILGILKAYEILRTHFNIRHKLVLAGKEGFGAEQIAQALEVHPYRDDIVITGFVSEQQKWSLLRHSAVFIFPTFYEGFGLPVLEAQQVGTPVVTSNTSSLGEIVGKGDRLSVAQVDPKDVVAIARETFAVLDNSQLQASLVEKGLENCAKYTWEKAARLTVKMILAK